jgi:hypothetical protein
VLGRQDVKSIEAELSGTVRQSLIRDIKPTGTKGTVPERPVAESVEI